MTDVESAYYFFLKSVADPSNLDLLKVYEPQILEDIGCVLSSKLDIVEGLMREYDLVHYFEGNGLKKREAGLAKQKLIFYMAYIKSRYKDDVEQVEKELLEFRQAYIEGKVVSKKEMI